MNLLRRPILCLPSPFSDIPSLWRVAASCRLTTLFTVAAIGFARLMHAAEKDARSQTPEWAWAEASYFAQGRYSDALRVVENMREYLRRSAKSDSAEFIELTTELGVILTRGLGDHARAASAYKEADSICIRLFGPDSIARLEILNRQCELLDEQKHFSEAAEIGRAAVRLVTKVRGPNSPETAEALHYLALALADLPETGEAETVLRRVLSIRRKTEGDDGYWTGLAWNNLGVYDLQVGQVEKAREAILAGEKILSKHISVYSPDGVAVQRNLIRLALDSDDRLHASQKAIYLLSIELELFRKSFPSLDEGGRLNLKSRFEPARWFCTLGAPVPIAQTLLQTKAITLDQMLATPAPSVSASDLFAHLLLPENAAQGLRPITKAAIEQRSKIARESLTQSSRTATTLRNNQKGGPLSLFPISPKQVCAALPSNSVAIEFTRYKHYVGRFKDEERYGALVFRPSHAADGSTAEALQWVPLGPAEKIDREVNSLLESATDSLATGTLATRLRELYELIWSPVAKAVPSGTENVFLSPDGQLCFLPFSALLGPDNQFLADRHLMMYLSTMRDLFRPDASDQIHTDRFMIFAAPNFGQRVATNDSAPGFRFRDADARSLQDLKLVDLPGTRTEAGILENLAHNRQFKPGVFTDEAASKSNVVNLEQPRIVHFATHGFMLPPAVSNTSSNPMDRSGLALAGAQASLTAMANGQTLPPVELDGLLTARQVAKLRWQGTWLVTLSACNTGRGEAHDGESVLGLRRGFLAAGVENLLLSLWKISDEETVGFMRDFYTRALDSKDAATALALTQREWLARIRKERGIAAAVTTAGAFVLNTSGRLPKPAALAETK